MDTEVLVALVTAAGSVLATVPATFWGTKRKYAAKIEKLEHERDQAREVDFEHAQIGYRKLYGKLRNHYEEAERNGSGFGALRKDVIEAEGVGFKPVCDALRKFWPEEHRLTGKPPLRAKYQPVVEAMQRHGSMRLRDLDQMRSRGEA